jgi:hypothetical protein
MPWGEIGLHSVALIAFPGALTLVLLGALGEWGAAWALVPERGGLVPAGRSVLRALLPSVRPLGLPPMATAAALMTLLAATQLAIPLSPVPTGERNLMVAAIALATAGWAAWAWGWNRRELNPRLVVAVQAVWLLAVFAPAVVPENLRPEALGAVMIGSLLPLKIACAVLYLFSLPVLMQLIPEAAPQGLPAASGRRQPGLEAAGFGLVRVLLWLPYCGLFASLYFPPFGDDAVGLLRFLGVTAGSAAVAIFLAANLVRRTATTTNRLYAWIVVPFGWLTLGIAMLTAAYHGV